MCVTNQPDYYAVVLEYKFIIMSSYINITPSIPTKELHFYHTGIKFVLYDFPLFWHF